MAAVAVSATPCFNGATARRPWRPHALALDGKEGGFRAPPVHDPQGREPRTDHATHAGTLSDGELGFPVAASTYGRECHHPSARMAFLLKPLCEGVPAQFHLTAPSPS